MMMLQWFKISCIILILCNVGCTDENDLKLPVRTNLEMRFRPMYLSTYNESEEISISASMRQIGIKGIEFEGMREVGDDIFFETNPEIDLLASQYYEKPAAIADFYLPQGIYNYIRMDLYLQTINELHGLTEDETDSTDIGIIITGAYYHLWLGEDPFIPDSVHQFPFYLLIDKAEQFLFRSAQDVVIKQPDSGILIVFDMEKTFQSMGYESFEKAEKSGNGKNQNIIFSSTKNRELYEILLYRLGMSTRMVVY